MKNYKKITLINGPFKVDILFPIDELGQEKFNIYMDEINKINENGIFTEIKVEDVSYKKVPKHFKLICQENLV